MKLAIVEKKTFLAGLQCTLTSSCAKTRTAALFLPVLIHGVFVLRPEICSQFRLIHIRIIRIFV